jgi:hypothetical protein
MSEEEVISESNDEQIEPEVPTDEEDADDEELED